MTFDAAVAILVLLEDGLLDEYVLKEGLASDRGGVPIFCGGEDEDCVLCCFC